MAAAAHRETPIGSLRYFQTRCTLGVPVSSTNLDSSKFATQMPSASSLVPVQAPPPPVVVVQPPKKRMTFAQARDFLAATDLDGSRPEHGGSRTWATFNNGINSALATGHCIPGVSAAVAPFSIGWGAVKFGVGLLGLVLDAPPGVARGLWVSGAKSMALGASVFLLPGVSEALNLVAAVKDGADVLNAAVDNNHAKAD